MPIYVKADKVKSDHTYTQFPITINDNTDSYVPEWSLFGAGSQTDTPTPDAPIMPEFVGVRTGNLFDDSNASMGTWINNKGSTIPASYAAYQSVVIGQTTNFIIKYHGNRPYSYSMAFYDSNGDFISRIHIASPSSTYDNFIVPEGAISAIFQVACVTTETITIAVLQGYKLMLNSGSTALPYEPYGWAEKITCAGQTVPVYLGQTPTVRRIKKLVLTGEETNWSTYARADSSTVSYLPLSNFKGASVTNVKAEIICTHYETKSQVNIQNLTNKTGIAGRTSIGIIIADKSISTLDNFKSYLASQYANGTPVTVWYILNTPETGIVNEPLCKIGDYSDELHSEDVSVTLSLQTGASNIVSIESALQPSKMNISYYSEGYTDVKKIPMSGDREVKHVLDANGLYVYKSPNYYNWQNIRDIVRAGKGETYYPVGSIIYDNFDSSTGTAFQVVAHDHHFDPTLTAQGYTHSITLCQLKLDIIQFDAVEVMLYLTRVMPAGTYRFTLPNYDALHGGNKTYYFTTTRDIPVDGVIVLNWPYQRVPQTVSTYPTVSSTIAINSNLTLTEWDDSVIAVDLGTVTLSTTVNTGDYGIFNYISRARYGSNNYYQSGLRQLINTDATSNTWWQPQTIFDRPYSNRTLAGYLSTLNPDFVNVLATPEITYITNNVFEYQSLDGTTFTKNTNYTINTDKMFLLSHTEVNLSPSPNIGSILDYYVNADNTKRIKYIKDNNNVYYWWLRTPYPSDAHGERNVGSSGGLSSNGASDSNGSAPACIIQ